MNIPTHLFFHCNEIRELSDQYNLQVPNYIFQLLYFNIDEEIEAIVHVNNKIYSRITRSNDQMSRSKSI